MKHIFRRNGRNEPVASLDAVIGVVNDAFVQTRLSAGITNYRSRLASLHLGGGIIGLVLRIGFRRPVQADLSEVKLRLHRRQRRVAGGGQSLSQRAGLFALVGLAGGLDLFEQPVQPVGAEHAAHPGHGMGAGL